MVSKFTDPLPNGAPAANRAPLIGALFVAAGLGIVAVGAGLIPTPRESFHAPREIVMCAGYVFAIAGVLAGGSGRLPVWLTGLAGAVLLTLLAIIPSWIAWGGGPREFSGNGSWLVTGFGLNLGRALFGVSAIVVWLCAIAAWTVWFKSATWAVRTPVLATLLAVVAWFNWAGDIKPAPIPGESETARLERLFTIKHADPDFSASSPSPYLEPRAEPWIKASRARLAAARKVPTDATVIDIARTSKAPRVDGRIDANEWRDARRFVSKADRHARFAMLVHGGKLYIAGESPADHTEQGFDQLRFWFHLGLAPALKNERVFLSRHGSPTALRAVVPAGKTSEMTEWGILRETAGASVVEDHRQFELEIDLVEAGLAPGTTFPFFLEIEGDPIRTAEGKFKARVTEGRVGSWGRPLWGRIPD